MSMGDRDPRLVFSDTIGWHMPDSAKGYFDDPEPQAEIARLTRALADAERERDAAAAHAETMKTMANALEPECEARHVAEAECEALKERLDYAVAMLRVLASGKVPPGDVRPMAQAGLDLATLGPAACAEMRGEEHET